MSAITSDDVRSLFLGLDLTVDMNSIQPDANLLEGGLDSLDMMNFFFAVEETYGVSVEVDGEDYNADDWVTINSITASLNALKTKS